MKERVYLNRVAVDWELLYRRAKDYFHRHGIDIDFEFVQTDYQNLSYIIRQFPQGERVLLQPYMANIIPIDLAYDFTSFVFNQAEFASPNLPTSYCYCPTKQPFIDIGTHPGNPKDLDYINICHEHMHALVILANQKGFNIPDVMDTYHNAMESESADSNFGQQWALLQPYILSLQPAPKLVRKFIKKALIPKVMKVTIKKIPKKLKKTKSSQKKPPKRRTDDNR